MHPRAGVGASQSQYVSRGGGPGSCPPGLYLTSVRQERWLRVGPTQLEPPSLLQGESTGKSQIPTSQQPPPAESLPQPPPTPAAPPPPAAVELPDGHCRARGVAGEEGAPKSP